MVLTKHRLNYSQQGFKKQKKQNMQSGPHLDLEKIHLNHSLMVHFIKLQNMPLKKIYSGVSLWVSI